MTFKDSSVIISNDDEGDVLENVDLQSSFKQKMKMKKQAEASSSTRYDTTKMLPQYDEEDDEEKQRRQSRIVLATAGDDEGFNGGMNPLSKEGRLDELREKLNSKH